MSVSGKECWILICPTHSETGRRLARDIGSGDPERMAAPRAVEYIESAFAGTEVEIHVKTKWEELEKEYPLAAAVARASWRVERYTTQPTEENAHNIPY